MTTGAERTAGGRRIAIAAPHGASLVAEAMPLIARLLEAGHKVLCLAPDIAEAEQLQLMHAGADVEELDLTADRFALLPERQVVLRIASRLKEWGADTVVARGEDVMAFVVMAATKAQVARIVAVQERLPGGGPETSGRDQGASLNKSARERLARAFDAATDVLCLNYDEAAELELSGLLPEGISPVVLPWSGVDLQSFAPVPLPAIDKGLKFLMIGELSGSRGVLDFCRAAQVVKERAPQTTFELAGPASRSSDALTLAEIAPFRETVNYSGDGSERAELITGCHVFVYPSHGGANLGPALEALSMGRPLVTCDAPGTRELVDERVNGCLAQPGQPESLATAMQSYLKRPDLIPAMARCSRQKAERRYDRRLVMAAMFDLLGLKQAETAEV